MLYVIFGNDEKKAREKFDKLLESLVSKRPDTTLFRINPISWDENRFSELVQSQGLFEQKYICALNTIFENKEAKEFFLEVIGEVSRSENIFILLEEDLDTKVLKVLEKHAEKVQEYSKEETSKKETDFNVFSITDAFGRRDKKELWVLYQKALRKGVLPEDIFWRLNWQLKTMSIVSKSKDPKEAEMKPFVFNKSKTFLKNYDEPKLKQMSFDLVELYHESRRGNVEFELGLEYFLMDI